jgi:glutathione S-transferase
MMESAGGWSLKEMLDKKLEAPASMCFTTSIPELKAIKLPKTAGKCEILGATGSMNCMGPILLATQAGCGEMKMCMPGQDTVTPEFLEMNPLGGVPVLKDGEYTLSESAAILRYMALTYAPDFYPNDAKIRGVIDRAMDFWACSMYQDAVATIYPVFGYCPAPEDKQGAADKCKANLEKFCKVFLKGKFVAGDKLSIADFKVAPFLYCYDHQALKKESLVDCPARIVEYNAEFQKACSASSMLSSAGGWSLKEMMDPKLGA